MKGMTGPVRVAVAGAALLGALSLVAWRQGRALDHLEALEQVQDAIAIELAEQTELAQRIGDLEGFEHVSGEAGRRLGLRQPSETEMRFFGQENR